MKKYTWDTKNKVHHKKEKKRKEDDSKLEFSQFWNRYLDVGSVKDMSHNKMGSNIGVRREQWKRKVLECIKLHFLQITLNVSFYSAMGEITIVRWRDMWPHSDSWRVYS